MALLPGNKLPDSADLSKYDLGAQAPVSSNVGPAAAATGMNAAGPQTLAQQLNVIQCKPDELTQWWKRIEQGEQRIADRSDKWDILLKAYMPLVVPGGTGETVKTNAHFRNVHTKIGQIFVKSPKVLFTAEGPTRDKVMTIDPVTQMPKVITAEETVRIKQEVLNKHMGSEPGMVNGLRLMDECLFDCLAWSHLMCVKVGYAVTMKPVQVPVTQPDPNYVPPPIVGLGLTTPPAPKVPVIDELTGQPKMQTIQVPVHEEWYARRFSPKKLIINADLYSTRFQEEATLMGMKFFMSKRQAIRAFGLTEQELTASSADTALGKSSDDDDKNQPSDMVEGYEIWYKASVFTDEVHPQAINQLVLIKGLTEKTVVHRPSPDQTFDAMGKLTPDSLIGFPIHVGTVRDLADSPFPPADNAFTNSQVKYQDTFLKQGVMLRDAQVGKQLYDVDAFDEDEIDLLKNGEVGQWVGVTAGKMQQGIDKVINTTSNVRVTGSADDYKMAGIIKQAMDETLGISSTQAGAPAGAVRSATEVSDFQQASSGRMKKERARAIEFYLSIVRSVDTLITRYASGQHYIMVEGEDGAKKLAQWNQKILQSAPIYSYSIKTDSQLDVDVAQDRQQEMNFYNMAAPDQLVNRVPILRSLAAKFGYNPWEIVLDPAVVAAGGGLPPHPGPTSKHGLEKSGAGGGNQPHSTTREQRNPSLTPAATMPTGGPTGGGQPMGGGGSNTSGGR